MHLRGEEYLNYKLNIKRKVKVVFSAFNNVENFKLDHVIVVLALVCYYWTRSSSIPGNSNKVVGTFG